MSKEKSANTDRLSNEEIERLKKELYSKLNEDRLYLDSSLSLKSLAEAIGSTSNNLSWLLNNIYKKNFYELINEYRIQAFLRLIEERKHETTTLFALAIDVGFNSKSTFNKAFKSIMNQTPSGYIKQLKNRISEET